MTQLPDAPWIRDAEQNGMPECEDVYCPICGAENPERIYRYKSDKDALGCDVCIEDIDAYDYFS